LVKRIAKAELLQLHLLWRHQASEATRLEYDKALQFVADPLAAPEMTKHTPATWSEPPLGQSLFLLGAKAPIAISIVAFLSLEAAGNILGKYPNAATTKI
jgi:hypothetical protein